MWWSNRSKYSLLWCVLYVCMIVAFSSLKHKQTKLIYKLTYLGHEDKATPKIDFSRNSTARLLEVASDFFQIYFTSRVFEHVNACSSILFLSRTVRIGTKL